MKNSEKAKAIFEKLENGHINLWHDISKEEFYILFNEVDWDKLDDVSFDFEMLKLFSKFRDAHTRYFIKNKTLLNKLVYRDDKLYINENGKYLEVISINNCSVEELYDSFSKIVCYETKDWKNKQIEIGFNSKYFYEMIGIKDELVAKLYNDNFIELSVASEEELKKRVSTFKPYTYSVINNILCLKYSACRDDKDLPFIDFVKEMKDKVEELNIDKYILDLRGNAGGNSEILNPFQDFVREKKLNGVLLIDSGVFSSGRFAIAKFKKEFNTLLIGTPTGGAASSYGYNNNDSVDDKSFSYSIRYWDFKDVFNDSGSINPDIYVENSIEDLENNYDRVLEYALSYLKNKN